LTRPACQGSLTRVANTDDLFTQWRQLLRRTDPDPLEVAALAATFERYFDAVKTQAVKAARASGKSWNEVAEAIGTSRQSAWERYRMASRARTRWWPVPMSRT